MKSFSQRATGRLLTLLLSGLLLVGCETKQDSAIAGGFGGAAVGAGTGAIIGAAITNGDVAASALLGGAIGAPIGVALALMHYANSEENRKRTEMDMIRQNQDILFEQERQLDILRRQVWEERPHFEFPVEQDEQPFGGATLGNPFM